MAVPLLPGRAAPVRTERPLRQAVPVLLVLLALATLVSAEEPERLFQLGFHQRQPAVFVAPQAGMTIRLAEIRYDPFGYVAGYRQEIVRGGRTVSLVLATDPTLEPTAPETLRYRAGSGDQSTASPTLAEWEQIETGGMLGFSPRDLGGVILRSPGGQQVNLTARLAYDDFGRQMLSEQEFDFEGTRYVVAYSGVRFDDFGRLSAYSAEIRTPQ